LSEIIEYSMTGPQSAVCQTGQSAGIKTVF